MEKARAFLLSSAVGAYRDSRVNDPIRNCKGALMISRLNGVVVHEEEKN